MELEEQSCRNEKLPVMLAVFGVLNGLVFLAMLPYAAYAVNIGVLNLFMFGWKAGWYVLVLAHGLLSLTGALILFALMFRLPARLAVSLRVARTTGLSLWCLNALTLVLMMFRPFELFRKQVVFVSAFLALYYALQYFYFSSKRLVALFSVVRPPAPPGKFSRFFDLFNMALSVFVLFYFRLDLMGNSADAGIWWAGLACGFLLWVSKYGLTGTLRSWLLQVSAWMALIAFVSLMVSMSVTVFTVGKLAVLWTFFHFGFTAFSLIKEKSRSPQQQLRP